MGLTGGIGSGKTTVSNLFCELGVPVIDADEIARQLTEPNSPALQKIVAHFGLSILSGQQLDREALRNIVFQNQEAKHWLEQLLHPMILHTMQQQASALNNTYCIMVIPLLAESTHIDFVDRVLVVDCPEALQIERVKARSQLTESDIRAILDTQATRDERLAIADDLVCNDGGIPMLKKRISELHSHYQALAGDHGASQKGWSKTISRLPQAAWSRGSTRKHDKLFSKTASWDNTPAHTTFNGLHLILLRVT